MAFVITDRCVKCGACESECPNNAIVEEPKKFAIDYRKCLQCGNCIDVCPNKAIDEIGGLSELNGVLRSDFGCSKTSYGRKFGDVRSTEKNYTTASEAVSLLEKFYRKYGSYDLNYDMSHFGIRPPSDTTVHSQIGTENISVKNMLNFFGTVKGRNSEYIVVVLTKNKAGNGSNMTDILSGIHKIMEEASL